MNFDKDVFRTSDERIEMVMHDDCPYDVLETVVMHDLDTEVVMAVTLAKLFDSKLESYIIKNLDITKEDILKYQDHHGKLTKINDLPGICTIPWNHVSTNAIGTVRMCCQMINMDKKDGEENFGTVFKKDGSALHVNESISRNRNAPSWKSLRKEMLDGKMPDICSLCWKEEANGIPSRREKANKTFSDTLIKALDKTASDGTIKHKDFPIEYWDLRFGNKCNLACRSCGPADSDLWYKDWKDLRKTDSFPTRGAGQVKITKDNKTDSNIFEWYNEDGMIDYIERNIKDVKNFYFTGGEPTINNTHRKLLQYCIDNNHSKNITLEYNTNMAGVPSKIFEQWKKFKEVNLGMSIDGIFEHFEYIRYPGKWDSAYKNITRIDKEAGFENVYAGVSLTLSIMNVLHILDMQWWMLEQKWQRIDPVITIHNLYGPAFYNIQNLTNEQKEYVQKRYNKFINDMFRRWPDQEKYTRRVEANLQSITKHMSSVEQSKEDYNNFFTESKNLDNVRNQDWTQVLPEVYNMIKETNEDMQRIKNVKLATTRKK